MLYNVIFWYTIIVDKILKKEYDKKTVISMSLVKGGILVKDAIEARCKEVGAYVISTKATVRQTAEMFKISKSTVHKDVAERLPEVDPAMAKKVRKVLDKNKKERHLRGGMATKKRYQKMRRER